MPHQNHNFGQGSFIYFLNVHAQKRARMKKVWSMQANIKLSHFPKSNLNTSFRQGSVEAKLISSTVSHPRGLSSHWGTQQQCLSPGSMFCSRFMFLSDTRARRHVALNPHKPTTHPIILRMQINPLAAGIKNESCFLQQSQLGNTEEFELSVQQD